MIGTLGTSWLNFLKVKFICLIKLFCIDVMPAK